MIASGWLYGLSVLGSALGVWLLQHRYPQAFRYVPGIVWLYGLMMLFASLGLWQQTAAQETLYLQAKALLLPSMIFLLLLEAKIGVIATLGPRLLLAFGAAALSIMSGFVFMYWLMHPLFDPLAWKGFAALSGSWMGGSGNMVAISEALGLREADLGNVLLTDTVDYGLWVMLLLLLVPAAPLFNRFTRSKAVDASELPSRKNVSHPFSFPAFGLLLGITWLAQAACRTVAPMLPDAGWLSATTWTVLLITLTGMAAAATPIAKISGAKQTGSLMLYALIALIASRVTFDELQSVPLYLGAGALVLGVHALLMLLFARWLKLDLFTCSVASLANIGGIASAPIIAAAHAPRLVWVGVVMALLGYIVGTFGGLITASLLAWIGSA